MPFFGVNLHGLERHGEAYADENDRVFISLPERVPPMERDDSGVHVVQSDGGETLMDVAILYYKELFQNPVDMAEIIAQFQEHTVVDMSVPLDQGTILLLPSVEFIADVALGDSLSEFPQL
jgi:hypothetical protein